MEDTGRFDGCKLKIKTRSLSVCSGYDKLPLSFNINFTTNIINIRILVNGEIKHNISINVYELITRSEQSCEYGTIDCNCILCQKKLDNDEELMDLHKLYSGYMLPKNYHTIYPSLDDYNGWINIYYELERICCTRYPQIRNLIIPHRSCLPTQG
jgi:hypothetical protein